MTTANKLTILRMLLIPIMVILWTFPFGNEFVLGLKISELIATTLFILATFTDFLDGYIARKYDQITNLGKFLDPLADKVLVMAAMTYLIFTGRIAFWAVTVIIFREFMVTGIRLLAVEKGDVIAASNLGKYKTASTMIALIIMLFNDFNNNIVFYASEVVWYLAVILTVISGLDYLFKNIKVFKE